MCRELFVVPSALKFVQVGPRQMMSGGFYVNCTDILFTQAQYYCELSNAPYAIYIRTPV